MLDASTPHVQVLPSLTRGSLVRVLTDNTVGELTWLSPETAYVVHGDHVLGRGPWIFHPSQLVPATPAEQLGYWERYEAKLISEGAPASAVESVRRKANEARKEVES